MHRFPGALPREFETQGKDIRMRLSHAGAGYLAHARYDPATTTPITVQASLRGEDALVGLFMYRHGEGWGSFSDVWVDPTKRRRGVATAVYDEIERRGVAVVPSSGLDEDGALFWEARLLAKGVIARRP